MDVKDFAKEIAALGLPLLGAVLPIPGGEALGRGIAAALGLAPGTPPDQILASLRSDPSQVIKAQMFEEANRTNLERIKAMAQASADAADVAQVQAVNSTMQAEAQNSSSENWWQTGWRPFLGYCIGVATLLSVIFICYLFYRALAGGHDAATLPAVLATIPQLATSIATLMAIPGAGVGITAWHRGMLQRENAQADNGPQK